MVKKIDNQSYFSKGNPKIWESPPIVIAWKFSSAENIGSLLRVCDNFGIKQVLLVGNKSNYKISRIKRNATTSINKIKWQFISENDVWKSIPQNLLKIAVDTTSKSIALNNFNFTKLKEAPSDFTSFCFFFGNETVGLNNDVINRCNLSIHIPLIGNTLSMNVTQAAAVILFEANRQCLRD